MRIHSLTRASELNDSFGVILEFLPDKERYRVELENGETGLFRSDSLEDMSPIVDELTDALLSYETKGSLPCSTAQFFYARR